VDDDASVRRTLHTTLYSLGFDIGEAGTGEEALALCRIVRYEAVLLDINMPGKGGIETCRELRRLMPRVAILMLSVNDDHEARIEALEAGADDYITKPFGARELSARVQVALRHSASAGAAGASLSIGRWRIDLKARTARDDAGQELHLTPIEYRLLEVLAEHIGFVVTHRVLLQQVWGPGSATQTHYLRVYMKQLRGKLEPDPARPHWLLTDTGVGYRLAQREES
jgi:two-component system, OmpR family, KDP operon response regulator KdpE